MGTYRLALAVLVMLGHMGINFGGRAQGVASVVSFFIISGFVMTATIRRNFSSFNSIPRFFVDRAMRIFPQYLLYVFLTVAAFAWVGIEVPFMSGITAENVIANALLVPLGLYSWNIFGAVWIPQGWSLGLEATFYLVIPFLIFCNLRKWVMIPSMMVFTAAYLGYINTEIWGYMSLSGTLFMFLCGSFLYEIKDRYNPSIIVAVFIFSAALFYHLTNTPSLHFRWSYEVLLGLIIGLPVVFILSRIRTGALDHHLGNISYGVYLNHSLIIFLFDAAGLKHDTLVIQAAIIASSILAGWITFNLVEKPVIKLRRHLRSSSPANSTTRAPGMTGANASTSA